MSDVALDPSAQYFAVLHRLLAHAESSQRSAIERAGVLVARSVAQGALVYTFGSGHSRLVAEEVYARAGGLACVIQIVEPQLFLGEPREGTELERQEGVAAGVLARYDLRAGDTLIVISNSGRNAVPIEMAMLARERGANVIVITSLAHSQASTSRHSSGKRLFEIADVVLDNLGEPGDAALAWPSTELRTAPTSTVIGAALINAVMLVAIQELLKKGVEPPILTSSNLDGSDERNWELLARYKRTPGE